MAPAGSQGSRLPGSSASVVAARARDLALADLGKALVTLRPAAADVGGTPGPAPPYFGPPPSPVLLGPGGTLATPHLALAEVDGIQDSTLAVLEVTPGLALADAGGTLGPALAVFRGIPGLALADARGALGPALAVFGGTPSLHTAAGWVIPGLSPADIGETLGQVAAHSEETRAPSFLLGLTRTPQGPVSPVKLRRGSRGLRALGPPAAGCV